jgi:hypothetical protein
MTSDRRGHAQQGSESAEVRLEPPHLPALDSYGDYSAEDESEDRGEQDLTPKRHRPIVLTASSARRVAPFGGRRAWNRRSSSAGQASFRNTGAADFSSARARWAWGA